MNFLEKYSYHKDDPREFGINPKNFENTNTALDNSHISNLLSTSIKVSKDLIPTVANAIEKVFERLK